jgi:CheY-like chemotaxis protein
MSDKLHIIVVDDEPLHIRLIEKAMRSIRDQVEFRSASNGREGLELIQRLYDEGKRIAVILDLNMPVMTGFEVLDVMYQDVNLGGIPVVILTTTDNPEDVGLCAELGYTDYLIKPPNYESIMQVIDKVQTLV